MADLYKNINSNHANFEDFCIRLNHFGSLDKVNSISFVDLLQTYTENPDSINFKGKLVLVTVTASGIANIKSTPFDYAFPSSLVHLTVAENLINKNYLVDIPLYLNLLILLLLVSCFWLIEKFYQKSIVIFSMIILTIYWISAIIFFGFFNIVLTVFYPSLAILALISTQLIFAEKDKQKMDFILQEMLKTELNKKEKELLKQVSKSQDQVLQLEKEIRDLKSYNSLSESEPIEVDYEDMIYSIDSKMAEVLKLVSKVIDSDIPVLIYGETGTGKEMIANAIHKKSSRNNAPFVALNCGALPETLLESELFGHEKGSFTGAVSMRKGKFEMANGGVIFLDEISETSPAFQAKLLRVLQESTFERVGGEKSIQVDIRVIAATNKNLQLEIDEGRFRSDLFFRLNGFPISLPPLRERPEDIPLLINHFLKKYEFTMDFSETTMQVMKKYSWPGNVRELENNIRRAAIMASAANRTLIQIEDLPDDIRSSISSPTTNIIHKPLEDQILESLRLFNFSRSSISQTAKILGNKDRGTITEYFRGICFQTLSKTGFNIAESAKQISGTTNAKIIQQVETKISEYLNNLKSTENIDFETASKGLPKKYHEYLEQVINFILNKPT
jgi:transcriptional regulator with GAF, ATPase, and Fis domain